MGVAARLFPPAIRTMLRRILVLSLSAVMASSAAILGGAHLSPPCERVALSDASFDVAVVLGAGMHADGRLHRSTRGRVEAGVALYLAGRTPRLYMTGGALPSDGPSAGGQMAAYAEQLGVPTEDIGRETRSLSTLQNALFSKPDLGDETSLILVTEGFHITRSWLSFGWAGIAPDAACHSARFRENPGQGRNGAYMLGRELLAFWFNLARAPLWSLATALGVSRETADPWLN